MRELCIRNTTKLSGLTTVNDNGLLTPRTALGILLASHGKTVQSHDPGRVSRMPRRQRAPAAAHQLRVLLPLRDLRSRVAPRPAGETGTRNHERGLGHTRPDDLIRRSSYRLQQWPA